MDEFSGIRARKRPNRGARGEATRRFVLLAPLFLAPALLARSAAASDHAPAPPPAEPPAPPPPPPPAAPAERPPPPRLNGPVAGEAPRPRPAWIVDPTNGRVLDGHDPVAYFLEGRPTLGDPDLQLDWQGATWLFEDEGTRAAFRDAPEVYAPRFDGRCAFAVSQGRPAEGSPLQFVIYRGKLLLFADAAARTAFLLAPDRIFAEAERRWPAMRAELP